MLSKIPVKYLAGWLSLSLFSVGFLMLSRSFLKRQRIRNLTPDQMKALISNKLNELVSPSLVPFIVSVAAHETGGFRSPVLHRNRNLFGMRLAEHRPTEATGDVDADSYANYRRLEDSVTDFYLWMDYTDFPWVPDLREFIKQMKARNYFQADELKYYRAVAAWYDKLYFKDGQYIG